MAQIEPTEKAPDISQAFDLIQAAMDADGIEQGSYAHAWYCNIRMSFYDALCDEYVLEPIPRAIFSRVAHNGAVRFMYSCFGIDFSKN